MVDTLGLLWALVITPASVQDRDGGKLALEQFRDRVKFPKVIWADTAYHATARWAGVLWNWYVEIVTRPRGRFEIQRKRWIVERTFGWWNRSRRLAKCYERTTESEQAFILVTMIHLMARRLGFVSKHYVRQILRSMCWMKAIRIMPPKLIAVFSKREKMRRLSFSQPIRRSMMLRSR